MYSFEYVAPETVFPSKTNGPSCVKQTSQPIIGIIPKSLLCAVKTSSEIAESCFCSSYVNALNSLFLITI